MPTYLVLLTLFAALLHASWNTLLRGGTDRLWTMTIMCMAIAFTCVVVAPFLPLPAYASWKYALLSALLHVGYNLCLVRSYQSGDLGQTYPIARGSSPLMVTSGAALFAGDLFRMYSRYAEARRWRVEILSANEGEHGGYKEVIAKISGDGVYGRLKFESGGHRVQRVPATESQGRIHTSACTVAVMPELPEAEMPDINPADLRIDTFRSSGAGGQHVNTTDSAIRITHLPTGIVVECQDERSQHKNKAKALSVLGSRIRAAEVAKRQQAEASTRRNLLGSGDRSDRNRTYNFPQGRVTDHRINLTLYRLDETMEGKLDMLIEPIVQEYQADQLAALSEQE